MKFYLRVWVIVRQCKQAIIFRKLIVLFESVRHMFNPYPAVGSHSALASSADKDHPAHPWRLFSQEIFY